MESMDPTDEWLIRSKADLTRTIGGVLDTVEHMHQEFRAFENSTQSGMNQHKQHIDNLEQEAMSILGAHGALDQKLEAMHNDLEEYKRQTSEKYRTHIQEMKAQERHIEALNHQLDSLRASHSNELSLLKEQLAELRDDHAELRDDHAELREDHTALSDAHEKHKSWWHWFFGKQCVNDPSSQYMLQSQHPLPVGF